MAVGTGLALGELAAGLVSPSLSPVTAVGGAVIDVVPPGVKDWAISLFGTADKVALLGGMGLVIAALAALAGVVELRRRFAGVAIIAVFGVAGLAAVLGRSELTPNAVPVPLLAAVVGMILLQVADPAAGGVAGRSSSARGSRRRSRRSGKCRPQPAPFPPPLLPGARRNGRRGRARRRARRDVPGGRRRRE